MDVNRVDHDLVTILNLFRTNENAASNGSVRCWTSALTANLMSRMVSPYQIHQVTFIQLFGFSVDGIG